MTSTSGGLAEVASRSALDVMSAEAAGTGYTVSCELGAVPGLPSLRADMLRALLGGAEGEEVSEELRPLQITHVLQCSSLRYKSAGTRPQKEGARRTAASTQTVQMLNIPTAGAPPSKAVGFDSPVGHSCAPTSLALQYVRRSSSRP